MSNHPTQRRSTRSRRKPRQPRGTPQGGRKAQEAAVRMKIRVVSLESRMTVLELFLGLHDSQPPLQTAVDAILSVAGLSEEE